MPKPHYHLSTNVGSLGSKDGIDDPEAVSEVRRNLYNVIKEIDQIYGYPDSVGIQESGVYNMELAPKFGLPIATDEAVKVIDRRRDINLTRGVVTYGGADARAFNPVDLRTEIVTTIHNVRIKGSSSTKDHKVGIINVYRLQNKKGDCPSLSDIKEYIRIQTARLRNDGISKVLVHGDFNAENLTIDGYKEYCHPDAYHKHKEGATKKYIDKVFANFDQVWIEEVYSTCENKGDSGSSDIGHKAILIGIGNRPNKPDLRKIVKLKEFKKRARKIKWDFKLKIDDVLTKSAIDQAADFITNETILIKNSSEKTVDWSKRSAESKILQVLEAKEDVLTKDCRVANTFYKIWSF